MGRRGLQLNAAVRHPWQHLRSEHHAAVHLRGRPCRTEARRALLPLGCLRVSLPLDACSPVQHVLFNFFLDSTDCQLTWPLQWRLQTLLWRRFVHRVSSMPMEVV